MSGTPSRKSAIRFIVAIGTISLFADVTYEGARSIKPELIEVAKSFRSSEWALWREVMLPYTLPYTMTGVRQAIGRALVGMIAAEFFLSSTGLGQLIMGASQNFDTGGLRVEIQDADGKPLPGFSSKDCDELIGNEIERAVSWKGKDDVAALTSRPVRLRIEIKDADLYALRFE